LDAEDLLSIAREVSIMQ
jgi:calcium-dependent protein kinase